MIKPAKLEKGDKVAAITLSFGGPGTYPERYEIGKKQIEETFELTVVETKYALKDREWIYKNPKARAEDLMQAFLDPSIKAIFSTIGGDDSIRILPFLDLNIIKNNPKIFLGFSDSTVTHFACSKAGLNSFYGPSIMTDFAENGGMFEYTIKAVKKMLFSNKILNELTPNYSGWTSELLDWNYPENQNIKRRLKQNKGWNFLQGNGISRGKLIGGCIDVLEFLRGSKYWPEKEDWENSILFLETSEEVPSIIMFKRWLRNYGIQGILTRLSGILLGRPGGNINENTFKSYEDALIDIVVNEFGLIDLPIVTNMDFGHTSPSLIMPYGVLAEIDSENEAIRILENTVV